MLDRIIIALVALIIGIRQVNAAAPPQAAAAGFNSLVFSTTFNNVRRQISPNGGGNYPWYNGIWYEAPSPASDIAQYGPNIVDLSQQVTDAHDTTISTVSGVGGPYPNAWTYGYYEVNAAMPEANLPQAWDAIWLFSLPHMLGTDTTPNGNEWCELDIMEQFGNGNFVGTVHDWILSDGTITQNTNAGVNNFQPLPNFDQRRWHTYGVLWTGSTITWYLDNVAIMSYPTPAICQTQQLFFLLTSMIHPTQTTTEDLRVYWVHVWH
jgi:hypothetical protein